MPKARTARTARIARFSPVSVQRKIVCFGEECEFEIYYSARTDGFCYKSGPLEGEQVLWSEFEEIRRKLNKRHPGDFLTIESVQDLIFAPHMKEFAFGGDQYLVDCVSHIERVTPMFAVQKIGNKLPAEPATSGHYQRKGESFSSPKTEAWFFFFKEDAEKYINKE